MSIGDSDVGICNTALVSLGELPIVALTDNNKRAILCLQEYDKARRHVLGVQPWSCARKQAQIAQSAVAPLFTWQAKFPMPDDFIRFYAEGEDYDMSVWEIMADPDDGALMLYSNDSSPLNVIYVYDLQDCTKMSAPLVDAIALELVTRIGLAITQNQSRVESAMKQLSARLDTARSMDSQQRAPREWDVDVLLRARR